MAEAKTPSAQYLSGEDPEIVEANKRYQDAVARLSDSLANRKMMFDPTLLAMAEGFLSPTQTGGFGESLGKAAGKVGAAQEIEDKRQMGLREREVAVAGQGIELQRMKQRDAELLKYLGESQPPSGPLTGPQAGATAAPRAVTLPKIGDKYPYTYVDPIDRKYGTTETRTVTQDDLDQAKNYKGPTVQLYPDLTEPRGAGALSQAAGPKVVGSPQGALSAMQANKPPGFENVEGIQTMPANPNFMTGRDYVRLNRMDKSKSAADLIKEGQEIEQKRYRDKEGGVQDLASGKFYSFPTGKTEEIQLYGYPGTHKVDARTAAKLSLLAANDDPAYHDLAKRVVEGPRKKTDTAPVDVKPTDAGVKTDGAGGAPSVSSGASSGRLKSVQELALDQEKAKNELAILQKEAEKRAEKLGEAGAAKEATLEETDATARRIYGSVTRVADYLKQSPNYFGIFARPGITAAIGNLIKEGIQTPSGSLNLAGFEDSMRKMMPGVTQKDLDNVTKAATELAEIELAFTRLYLAKQGAVTEGERKIVRAIPGTTSTSPEVLRSRMELLKSRSQFDIDTADAFRQWQDKNPGRSYLEFERKSDLYKEIKKGFEAETEKIFGGIKAVPTSQRKQEAAPAGAPAGAPSPGFIRDPKTGVIRRKKAGE